MTTYTIKPNELEAISLASSTEETRYYMRGVCVEVYADGTTGLIAIDGHRMASVRAKKEEQPVTSFIIESADIKKALQLAKAAIKESKTLAALVSIFLTLEDNCLKVVVGWADKETGELFRESGQFTSKPVGCTFPDWRCIIPTSKTGDLETSFNASYMADFGKMAKLLSGTAVQQIVMRNTGAGNPMIVTMPYACEFFGVLMPMRA